MLAEIKNNPLMTQPVIIKIKPISVDAKSGLITSQGLYIGQVGRFILLKSRYKSSLFCSKALLKALYISLSALFGLLFIICFALVHILWEEECSNGRWNAFFRLWLRHHRRPNPKNNLLGLFLL